MTWPKVNLKRNHFSLLASLKDGLMRREREKYLTIFEVIPNPAFVLDTKNRIEDVNIAGFEVFLDKLSPGTFGDYKKVPITEVLPWLKDDFERFIQEGTLEMTIEKEVETRKGLVHFQIKLKRMVDPFEKLIGTLIILNDISYLKQAEKTVARTRDFYLTLFEELPALIWRGGPDGECNYFNRAWLQFTGQKMVDEIQAGWMRGVHEEDVHRCRKIFQAALSSQKPFELECRLRRHDGVYRWILNVGRPFKDLAGDFAGYIGTGYDITERKRLEDELSYMATHDVLTGLPNRRVLETELPRALAKTDRGGLLALLVMDLDGFKDINDIYGHHAGDLVLITIGMLLKKQLRESDLLARLGGDEFAVLLEDIQKDEGPAIAQRLCESVAQHDFLPDRGRVRVSLSVGLSLVRQRDVPEAILSRTDKAMYKAKELGGNRIVFA